MIDPENYLKKNQTETKDFNPNGISSVNENINLIENVELRTKIPDVNKTSIFQTMMLLIKSNVGTGILAMGLAIKRSGILFGPVFMLIISIPVIHCMHLLLDIKKMLKTKNYMNDKYMGYDDIAELSMSPFIGSKSYLAKFIINVFLCFAQFGFCSAYFVFMSQTIFQLTNCTFGDVRIWILFITIPVIPLSFIKNLRGLSFISFFANILTFIGIGGMLFYIFSNLKNPLNYPLVAPFKEQPLFLASVLFAFEGINVVLPICHNMRKPEKFTHVLNLAMFLVFLIYLLVGFMGYLAFGDSIRGNITLNLPSLWIYSAVKACYMVAIFFTLFIQFYIPAEIIVRPVVEKFHNLKNVKIIEWPLRTLLIILIALVAIVVPKLDNVINLIGSLVCSFLSLIFPPFFHSMTCFIYLKTYKNSMILTYRDLLIIKLKIFKNILIIILGLVACIVGLYTTIEQIISDSKADFIKVPGCLPVNHMNLSNHAKNESLLL